MYKLPDGKYCGYLRKSRVDLEAEASGEEDTYQRHERTLLELAGKLGVTLEKIYREKPISGERISARPEMMKLLEDVEDEQWTGVFAVEVERLARGDTMDQGIVAQAFKYSNTLIVTPMRTYNPNDPNDEEYFEFNLFMSRREFKTITRRLQSGRVSSVKEGRYIGNKPPYGYVRVKLQGKGYSLEPHPEQAPIVQLIYSLYTDPDPTKRMGTAKIAHYLNYEKKIPSANNTKWTVAQVNKLIRNPIYIGKVMWGTRPEIKKRNTKSRPRREGIIVQGLHSPIIDELTYNLAKQIMMENGHAPVSRGKISNPFAGLIRCGKCGGPILLRPYGGKIPDTLMCPDTTCKNVSAYQYLVEERVLQGLRKWVSGLKNQLLDHHSSQVDNRDEARLNALEKVFKDLKKSLEELNEQRSGLHELVEKKVYTIEVYLERSKLLNERYDELKKTVNEAERELETERRKFEARYETIPMVERVLKEYEETDSPAIKNALLKSIIQTIRYSKDKGGRWSGAMDQFELTIEPKVFK